MFDRVLREGLPQFLGHDALVFADKRAPVVGGKVGIGVETVIFLRDFQSFFEQPVIDAEHDIAIHLNEAAIAVPRKARIARCRGEALDRFIVKAEIEDSVHHAGHRHRRAGANRDQQRVRRIAETLADRALDMRQSLGHRRAQIA